MPWAHFLEANPLDVRHLSILLSGQRWRLPDIELTYPAFGKGKLSSKVIWEGIVSSRVPFIFCLFIFLKLCFLLYVLWLFFCSKCAPIWTSISKELVFVLIVLSLTKRIFSFTTYIYIYIRMSLYNKDLHHVLLNELKLRTSPTASVKVLDLLEQLLPPKLTRMSRGRCWLWRVLKPLILWSKHWLVGLFVGDDFWIPFWIKQDFMVHLPGGFWSLLKRISR